jgi:multidrug efflux pump
LWTTRIVIIDCYIEKIDAGMSRWHAASAAAKEFFSSIFSATLRHQYHLLPTA